MSIDILLIMEFCLIELIIATVYVHVVNAVNVEYASLLCWIKSEIHIYLLTLIMGCSLCRDWWMTLAGNIRLKRSMR